MQTYDFSPFYRSTVGFDRLFSRLDGLVGQEQKTYPPYNIEKVGDNAYRISIAVASPRRIRATRSSSRRRASPAAPLVANPPF